MTTPSPKSMRFSLDEMMQGILATITADEFRDDLDGVAEALRGLSDNTIVAPAADTLTSENLATVLGRLEERGVVRHEAGKYVLTVDGRAACTSTKRTLFNARDSEHLAAAAQVFEGR